MLLQIEQLVSSVLHPFVGPVLKKPPQRDVRELLLGVAWRTVDIIELEVDGLTHGRALRERTNRGSAPLGRALARSSARVSAI